MKEITLTFRYLDIPHKGVVDTFTKIYSFPGQLEKAIIDGMTKHPDTKVYVEAFLTKDLE